LPSLALVASNESYANLLEEFSREQSKEEK